ncbi:MAG: hypothetical protein HC817_12625 [Saprospiraceae bacterium]|nr:hypothetical protein [Saprospiraceae bacterium]
MTNANICANVHSNGLSDAFIPAASQRGDGRGSWRWDADGKQVPTREAFGVNHTEETDPNNAEMRRVFGEIFLGNPFDGIDPVFRIDQR